MHRAADPQTLKATVKLGALRIAALPGVRSAFRPLLRGRAAIFMLHRFRNPDVGTEGHDPEMLRSFLRLLRRMRYEILDLTELLDRVVTGEPPLRGAIAFTIDDGYVEQATIAAPVFAEFDCPVTTFVTTGFLDRTVWFWWDQIEYVLRLTRRTPLTVELGTTELSYDLSRPDTRERTYDDLVARCKEMEDGAMRRTIARLAESAEVPLPTAAPTQFDPMTWDQLRRCESGGMSFGPHTVTHPILSRVTAAESAREQSDSWARVRAEARRPVPVFCYPNGRPQDAGAREVRTLTALGFRGAVLGTSNYARTLRAVGDPAAVYRVPRFGFPDTVPQVMQCVSGLERLKQLLRGERD